MNAMQKLINLLVTFLLATAAFGQKATITGSVFAMVNGTMEPQPFATVVIKDSNTGTTTDMDGNYRFTTEPGSYTLIVSLIGFEEQQRSVSTGAGGAVVESFKLQGEVLDGEQGKVRYEQIPASDVLGGKDLQQIDPQNSNF